MSKIIKSLIKKFNTFINIKDLDDKQLEEKIEEKVKILEKIEKEMEKT